MVTKLEKNNKQLIKTPCEMLVDSRSIGIIPYVATTPISQEGIFPLHNLD
jgi:hypothetical protein